MADLSQMSDADLLAALKASPDVGAMVTQEAQAQGVPPALALSVARAENGLKPQGVSSAGAVGPMQLMPKTAADLGVDPNDPAQNVHGGVAYLKQQLDNFGDPALAVAAYNAGPGAVQKAGGVPQNSETPAYVGKVMGDANVGDMSDADLMAALRMKPAPAPKPMTPARAAVAPRPMSAPAPSTGAASVLPSEKYYGANQLPNEADMQALLGGKPIQPHSDIASQAAIGAGEGLKPYAQRITSMFTGIAPKWQDMVQNVVSKAVTGHSQAPAPAPQSGLQSLARTTGQMAVNAAAPGSAATRIASVLGPALGSEGAAIPFKGTAAEAPARVVGAILGGGIAGASTNAVENAIADARNPRMTPEAMKAQASQLYTQIGHHDVQFTPTAVQSLHQGMSDVIGNLGSVYPTESAWVNTVNDTLAHDPSVQTLDSLRSKMQQALTTPTGSRTPDQLRVGSQLVDEIDSFMNAAARHPSTMTSGTGDMAQVGQLLGQARDLWRRMRNVQTVQNLAESAGIQNGSSYMGGNAQNMTARKLRTFVDPATNKSLAGLSPDEQQALRQVVLGTPTTNALKLVGNLAPNKGIGLLFNAIAGPLTGGKANVISMGVGLPANMAASALQRAKLDELLRMMATPGGLAPKPLIGPGLRAGLFGGAAQANANAQQQTQPQP